MTFHVERDSRHPRAIRLTEIDSDNTDSAGRDDTRSQPHVDRPTEAGSSGTTGESSARDARPRAAGAAPTRGAQPSGQRAKRITICCYCRKRIFQIANGEWYHERNSSRSCKFGEGSERRATPLEITVRDDQ